MFPSLSRPGLGLVVSAEGILDRASLTTIGGTGSFRPKHLPGTMTKLDGGQSYPSRCVTRVTPA